MLTPKENLLRMMNFEVPEYIPDATNDCWYCFPREILERGPMTTEAEIMMGTGGTGYDWFGVHWTFVEEVGAATPSHSLGHPPILTDITNWKETVKFPNLDSIDWKAAADRDMNNPDYPYDPSKLSHLTFQNGPFERLHALMGVEEALVALMLEPEAVKEFAEAIIDYKIELLDKVIEYYPVDIVELMDDYGHQNNAFMSADQWEELFGPPMKRFADHCMEKGIVFQLHSCGKVESLIPSFIKYGIHHWASCQPVNDLKSILHNYGRQITLWEGVELHEIKDREATEEEILEILERRVFSLLKGGAYIGGLWEFNETVQKVFAEFMEKNRYTFFNEPENRELP